MSEVDLRVVAVALAALVSVWPIRRSMRIVLAAVSGVLVVSSSWSVTFEARNVDWAIVAVVALAIALDRALPILYHSFTSPMYTWVLFAGCLGAIHVCVPENGQTAEVGLMIASGGVAEFLLRRRLPLPVWSAAVTAVMWTAVFGAGGQARAVIGGLFAVVPVVAVAAFVRPGRGIRPLSETRRWLIALLWMAGAWTVARTGGVADTARAAWLAVGIASVVAIPTSLLIRRSGVS